MRSTPKRVRTKTDCVETPRVAHSTRVLKSSYKPSQQEAAHALESVDALEKALNTKGAADA
jgi:hypothetical protein